MEEMNNFLAEKIERNMQLELLNDELKDAYRSLENSMSSEDQEFKNRVAMLERNVEQISTMY